MLTRSCKNLLVILYSNGIMENLPPARMLIYLSGEGEIRSLFSYSCIHIRSVNCDIKTTYSVSHHAQSREDEQHKTYPKNLWPLPPPAHSLKLTHMHRYSFSFSHQPMEQPPSTSIQIRLYTYVTIAT